MQRCHSPLWRCYVQESTWFTNVNLTAIGLKHYPIQASEIHPGEQTKRGKGPCCRLCPIWSPCCHLSWFMQDDDPSYTKGASVTESLLHCKVACDIKREETCSRGDLCNTNAGMSCQHRRRWKQKGKSRQITKPTEQQLEEPYLCTWTCCNQNTG